MAIEGHDGYEGRSQRTRWGCFAAFLFGAPVFAFLLFVDALGDCRPGSDCKHGFLSQVLVPGTIVALVAFFAARAAVGRRQRRNDRQ